MSDKAIDLEIAYLAPDPAGGPVPVKKELRVTGTWAAAIKTAKSLDSEGYVILGIIYRPPAPPAPPADEKCIGAGGERFYGNGVM